MMGDNELNPQQALLLAVLQKQKGKNSMNPVQIALVQDSFAQVVPMADLAADLFYTRLFTLDPALRSMFKGDMCEQKRKLMATLQFAVFSLSRLDHLLPTVRTLGERHAGYGVTAAHYDTVGQALLWTLEQGLGAVFTPDVKAAWAETYLLLAGVMQEATANVQMELVA